MSKPIVSALGLAALCILQACTPDCSTLSMDNIELPPGPFQANTEIAITASPSTLIQDREFHLSVKKNNRTEISLLDSRFEKSLDAAVLMMPDEVHSSAILLMSDPDCTGNLIPIGSSTSIQSNSFFVDNPFFITPAPPLIVIPSSPPSIPGNIVNDWFSPNNRRYCIWFKPDIDANGNELNTIKRGFFDADGNRKGSWELAAGCDNIEGTGELNHLNPITGIVDKENNLISIRIDRTSKNLGFEDFEGFFVDPDQMPAGSDYNIGGICNPELGNSKPKLMYLVSQTTKRQLLLWRNDD
ncbi:MAG: hypothetical protein KTR30_10740 [Saprospiraceae bacterium]|nr:hypothetical protein [Saprospiraceae bacterium]